jgi:hypothetical protein
MIAMGKWDDAHFREEDAHSKAVEAREAYKDALRMVNYGISAALPYRSRMNWPIEA